MNLNLIKETSSLLEINPQSCATVLKLIIEESSSIPFISRYRKEATGGLDEVQISNIHEKYLQLEEREKRRSFILETIESQNKLTPEIKKQIIEAKTLQVLEDIYAPYKSKRKTKGQIAIENGLGDLAEIALKPTTTLEEFKKVIPSYFNENLKTEEDVLKGVQAIITERIANDTEIKETLRKSYWEEAELVASPKKDYEKIEDHLKFKDYYEFSQPLKLLTNEKTAHRFMAIRRGNSLNILKYEVDYPLERALHQITYKFLDQNTSYGCQELIDTCIKKAYKLSIHPSLDLEVKSELKKTSDESAINVFGVNLKSLLLQPYLGQHAVIGIDPGVRTGCKIAVIDKNGNFLIDQVIYPHPPKNDILGSSKIINAIIEQLGVKYIAIGNGTFGKETLEFVQKNVPQVTAGNVHAVLVNEDGASIYSASEVARAEFPDMDLTVRGAISIARRFQDPLAELVKIDPKSIGVGQYQHDVNQSKLKKSLGVVVENCVNYVGVDLNTASAPLLSYISGISKSLAENIISYREKNKGLKTRKDLLSVSRFTNKVYEQCAGFLRIYDGEDAFDSTFIHPERYETLENWCKKKSIEQKELIGNEDLIKKLESDNDLKQEIGEFTFNDIIKSLRAPKQDPREEFKPFEYRKDLNSIGQLKVGEFYPGLVTNITQFGAFVDIGIKENGLIHVSQMSNKFVENPLNELKVGQKVNAKLIELDLNRKRISLSLKTDSKPKRDNRQQHRNNQPQKNNPFAKLKGFKI